MHNEVAPVYAAEAGLGLSLEIPHAGPPRPRGICVLDLHGYLFLDPDALLMGHGGKTHFLGASLLRGIHIRICRVCADAYCPGTRAALSHRTPALASEPVDSRSGNARVLSGDQAHLGRDRIAPGLLHSYRIHIHKDVPLDTVRV